MLTNDGKVESDYINLMDLVAGHLLALNYLIKEKTQNVTINLWAGKGKSVLELENFFQKVNKFKIPYSFADRR